MCSSETSAVASVLFLRRALTFLIWIRKVVLKLESTACRCEATPPKNGNREEARSLDCLSLHVPCCMYSMCSMSRIDSMRLYVPEKLKKVVVVAVSEEHIQEHS